MMIHRPNATHAREARSSLLRLLFSLYAWPTLALDTALFFASYSVLSAAFGREQSFAIGLRRWSRLNLTLGGFRCRIQGLESLPSPAVLVANHQHFFDVPLLAAVLPAGVRFVARQEIFKLPVVGSVLRWGGHVSVERAARRSNLASLEQAAALVSCGRQVLFFAEGRRSRDGRLGRLRSGAFRLAMRTGAPLVPVVVAGTRHTVQASTGFVVPSRLAVSFLPPRRVTPADARCPDFRERTRQEMVAALAEIEANTGPRI